MWQIEDMIRAMEFVMGKIEQQLVSKYKCDENIRVEITGWYKNLVLMMQKEHLEKKGHLQFINNTMTEVHDFHLMLLKNNQYPQYGILYNKAKPDIDSLSSNDNSNTNEIEIVLNAIYGVVLLKMKGAEVSKGTLAAVKLFSSFLSQLGNYFKKYEKGELEV